MSSTPSPRSLEALLAEGRELIDRQRRAEAEEEVRLARAREECWRDLRRAAAVELGAAADLVPERPPADFAFAPNVGLDAWLELRPFGAGAVAFRMRNAGRGWYLASPEEGGARFRVEYRFEPETDPDVAKLSPVRCVEHRYVDSFAAAVALCDEATASHAEAVAAAAAPKQAPEAPF